MTNSQELLDGAREHLAHCQKVIGKMSDHLAEKVKDDSGKRIDRKKIEQIQPQAFLLAKILSEEAAAKAMLAYGEKFENEQKDNLETGLSVVYIAHFIQSLNQRIFGREKSFGLDDQPFHGCRNWLGQVFNMDFLSPLALAMSKRDRALGKGGTLGLSGDHVAIRDAFARFAQEQLAPMAEEIHRQDKLIPEKILKGLRDLGVFGISIPEEYGGSFIDHRSMIIATEELSIASLGAGGSVITRPEICAKAILTGGTDDQKKKWLPKIASGEHMVCVAVTEPNAGSDVANVNVTAKKVDGGYVINGEKTWCTFAGRSDLFILLARTGGGGYKGLTLFLVEKPARTSEDPSDDKNNEYAFEFSQEKGGKIMGHAIPTIGYRGMHSFAVGFENYFVPQENQIGEEGAGFKLQMKGFSGGRIQTAARALGVMEAALREAMKYCEEREVFGKNLNQFPLTQEKLVLMAARVQAGRQLTYHVADLMDEGAGEREASLVKFLTCSESEWITREAMQLHGGMGYSEEYAVSRYWADARVLSIFEGAEEVLALAVITRQALSEILRKKG